MQPKNDQIPINQALNETAKIQQPKKTWVEPELVSMGVEGGINYNITDYSITENGIMRPRAS